MTSAVSPNDGTPAPHPHQKLSKWGSEGGTPPPPCTGPPTPTLHRTEILSRKLLNTFFGLLIILILWLKAER